MKKLLVVLFALLILCGCSKENIKGGDLDDIKNRGYIVVAMEGTWAPWTYHDESNVLKGYDVEVGQIVADYLGVDVHYVEGEWDGLLAGVEAGRYDMLINGCDVTEERQKSFDFSDAYAYDRIAVIVKGDNEEIKTMEDLKGKKTANTITSTYAQIATQYGADVSGVDDLNQTFLLLDRGDIDATINAEMSYNDYMNANSDKDFKIACFYEDSPAIGIAIKKGSSALVAQVNEAIAKARNDGSLSEISNKYFGTDITNKN